MTASLYIPTLHIIVVAPLLLYIGYNIYNKEVMKPDFGLLLMLLALVIFIYHCYKFYKYYNESK